jgi:protease I
MELQGKRVAILIATGFHEHELVFPYYRFKEAGAEVIVAGPEAKTTYYGEGRHGMDGLLFDSTAAIADLRADDLDALHIPGGIYGPMALRADEATLRLVRDMVAQNKTVGAICHGPWVLVSADVVRGRRIACPYDMSVDVTNAGGTYVNEPAVRDGCLVTSVYFGNLPEYMRLFIAAVQNGK